MENVVVSFDEARTRYAMAWGTNPGTSTVTAFLGSTVVDQAAVSTTIIDSSAAFLVVENITFDRIEISIVPDNSVVNSFVIDNVQSEGSNANSLSASGSSISATGSASLSAESLILTAENVPNGLGLFYFGSKQTRVRVGGGFSCIGGSTVRMPVLSSQAGGLEYSVDFSAFGSELAALGSVSFQAWFRDPAAGGSGFNFSNAVEIKFVP